MTDDTTHFGFRTVASRDKAGLVAGVFDSVAKQYDVMNDLMSLGTHRLMKRFAVEKTRLRSGDRVLDLAGGTGDLAELMAPIVGASGRVVLCDINASMLAVGRDRLIDGGTAGNVDFVQGNAECLPFPDSTFDAITIAFGLRNVTDKDQALASMCQALRPGGRLVVLEFSKARHPATKAAYRSFSRLWPGFGKLIVGDSESYQYLVESIEMHPDQDTLRDMMSNAGFAEAHYFNLADGVAALHIGTRPTE